MAPTTDRPRIILLYGEMGAGKSHVGRRLAKTLGYTFIEGDNFVPSEMSKAVRRLGRVTRVMRADLRSALLTAVCDDVRGNYVISQALYRKEDREWLIGAWSNIASFEVTPFLVKARFWTHLKRLWRREGGLRWCLYYLFSHFSFQADSKDGVVSMNGKTFEFDYSKAGK